MFVLLNPTAGGGRALTRWRGIVRRLEHEFGPLDVQAGAGYRATRDRVADALRRGERRFVAAGGDGTVNLLVGLLATLAAPELLAQVVVGAVGLGSSNDFHKPFRNGAGTGRIPLRLDFSAATPHDVGLLRYTGTDGVTYRRHWINNASIGVTADGNQRFNTPDLILRWLKRVATGAAIGYAALRALAAYRPRPMTLTSDDRPPATTGVSNLGIVKNPHFAGSLRYDSPREPASGRFYVHVVSGQSLPHLLAALFGLSHGRFVGRPRSVSWQASRLSVEASNPFAIEVDGEVILGCRAQFGLLTHQLRICP